MAEDFYVKFHRGKTYDKQKLRFARWAGIVVGGLCSCLIIGWLSSFIFGKGR